ncbi:hypothetical protein AYO21_01609 [Fonsecaea monophora]|uniref:1-alkyl-2-acetylglycerophosphocholine esterase n=1 Tax=Fonsecaea monophora TaxID=254056 RepID=A0A177FLF3_9EURO|nr:hypothetical protein AYO21_01609 [Fonsecaea monophora]OAG44152.1 hypothetical protein AYO21_01609 [Fonsecaea monophora]
MATKSPSAPELVYGHSSTIRCGFPYMPPATAAFHDAMFNAFGIPNGTFGAFRLQTCSSPPKNTNFPVLLFSTGSGGSRLIYNVLCQWVASMGFNVISIDHTYDAEIVEFPDGTVILGANITLPDDLAEVTSLRVADIGSALNALSNSTLTKQIGIPSFNISRVGIFGHSLGGATAANAILGKPRLASGLNMDGSVYGPAMNHSNTKPFTIFAAQRHNQSTDATWAAFWQELKGLKLQLQVNNTEHGTFTDYPILTKSLGINATILPPVTDLIGTIDGVRILDILRRYIGGFFQETLEVQKVKLIQGPSPQFPEVAFVNSSLTSHT